MVQFEEIDCDCVLGKSLGIDAIATVYVMVPVVQSRAKDADQSQRNVVLVVVRG